MMFLVPMKGEDTGRCGEKTLVLQEDIILMFPLKNAFLGTD